METLEKVNQFAIQRNREGIILDTVVLLLYFIGKYSVNAIKDFEPTHGYSKEDFELLNKIIKPFKRIIITPKIVAEVSNLSLPHLQDKKLYQYVRLVVEFLLNKEGSEEYHVQFENWENKSIDRLSSFGFVDMDMYEIAKKRNVPILTDDIRFYNFSKKEIPIIKLSVIKYADFRFA